MSKSELCNRAIAFVLSHEGGFSDDPNDAGGATNFGISLRYLEGVSDTDGDGFLDGDFNHDGEVDELDIRNMSRAEAVALYKLEWWDRYQYSALASAGGDPLAIKVFDLAVNMGPRRAHRLLQTAISGCGHAVLVDGRIGPASRAAIMLCDHAELMRNFLSCARAFYRSLNNPRYINGWLRRVDDMQGVTTCQS